MGVSDDGLLSDSVEFDQTYLNSNTTSRTPQPAIRHRETRRRSPVLLLCGDRAHYHGRVAELLRPLICELLDHSDSCRCSVTFSCVLDYIFVDEAVVVLCKSVRCRHSSVADENVTHAHGEHGIYGRPSLTTCSAHDTCTVGADGVCWGKATADTSAKADPVCQTLATRSTRVSINFSRLTSVVAPKCLHRSTPVS